MNLNKYSGREFSIKRAVWFLIQDYLFRFSPYPLNGLRCSLLRLFGGRIGKKVVIRPSVRIDSPWNLEIENNSWIGEDVILYSVDKIKIGNNVCISQRAFICTAEHDHSKNTFDLIKKPIFIGNSVWIGAASLIHPGVRIGDNSVIGAMSNVLKDIRKDTLNFGNPCRFIRKR